MPNRIAAPLPTIPLSLAVCLAISATMPNGGTAFAADGADAEAAAAAPMPSDRAAFAADGEEPEAAAAQPPPARDARDRPDFLFGQPRGIVGLSAGWLRASGGGVFDWFRDYLVLGVDADGEFIPIGDRAYDTVLFRFALGFSLSPRVDLVLDVAPASRLFATEDKDFTDNGQPIVQSTRVWQVPINASVRYWVAPRGRSIGRLAWVPSTVAFYVGAGAGGRWYRLEQIGDFVDYTNLSIYTDRLRSQGWALSRHVAAGISVRLTPRLFAVAEVRQVWSRTLASATYSFGDIDLNGVQMTGGVEFVF